MSDKEGQGGIVATWEATIEKSHGACFYAAHRAPATETSLKHTTLARFTRTLAIGQKRAEPLVVSPELLHPHHALRQGLLPFLVHNRGVAVKFRRSLLDNPR